MALRLLDHGAVLRRQTRFDQFVEHVAGDQFKLFHAPMRCRELAFVFADSTVEITKHVLNPMNVIRNRGCVAGNLVLLSVDLEQQFGDAAHRVFDRTDGVLGLCAGRGTALDLFDDLFRLAAQHIDGPADFLSRLACFAGERLYLVRDNGEGASLFTGPHGLDRGIERENISRFGNLVDFLAGSPHLVHCRSKAGNVLR